MTSSHNEAIKLHSFRETTCQSCSLRTLCLPISLDFQEVERLDSIITRSHPLKKGEHIFRQGESFNSLFAIRSGCIKTYTVTDSGDEQITGFNLPSELVGLSGMDTDAYPISGVAIETSSVCEIPYSKFDDLASKIEGLRKQLIHSLSKEIRGDLHMKLLLSQKNSEERVSNFLLDLVSRLKLRGYAADFIYLPMSRNEIANYLGLAVETVSRTLTRLHKAGVISVNGRAIEITDTASLSASAGSCVFSQ